MKRLSVLALALVLAGAGCFGGNSSELTQDDTAPAAPEESMAMEEKMDLPEGFPGLLSKEELTNKKVRLKTEKGDIVFEVYGDTAPIAASNFIGLSQDGFYDGLTFHRREEGFVIQGGDPNGNGTGGPGYVFPDELDDSFSYERGIVAMANRGPNTNGSQFFIMLGDVPLPKAYTIFGRVLEGMDIVDEIAIGDAITDVTVENL